MPDYDRMIRALYNGKEDGDFEPNPWVDEFIDDMFKKVDELEDDDVLDLSTKQEDKVEELYSEHIG